LSFPSIAAAKVLLFFETTKTFEKNIYLLVKIIIPKVKNGSLRAQRKEP
jgi:hypothetical protein